MSLKKKNILINCPSLLKIDSKKSETLGGIESLVLALGSELSKRKFNITISSIKKKTFIKNRILYLPINKIKKNAKNYDFDSIISTNDSSIFNYYKGNINKILWLHNKLQIEKSIRKKQLYSIIKNKPNAVFVSHYLNKLTSRLYFFKKRFVINNFLLPNFNILKIKNYRKPIFVWSVQREKGLDKVIEMWIKDIYKDYKNAKFYIYGINKLSKNYNKRYLNSKNIFYKGRVPKKELKKIYSKSMGMICLGYDETFCLNALEANACGLPVITFGKTALKNYVTNNHNGFIVNSISDVGIKIKYLLNMKSRKKIIYKSSIISKKYLLKFIIHDWIKLLR